MSLIRAAKVLPEPWGFPVPVTIYPEPNVFQKAMGIQPSKKVSGPFVWHGNDPATDDDIARLRAVIPGADVDEDTLVGRKDPSYTSFAQKLAEAGLTTHRVTIR